MAGGTAAGCSGQRLARFLVRGIAGAEHHLVAVRDEPLGQRHANVTISEHRHCFGHFASPVVGSNGASVHPTITRH
jgi:hypothetical protein